MYRLRRRRICIVITEEAVDLNKTLRETPLAKVIPFADFPNVHLVGITQDYRYDSWNIYICHLEFPPVPEGQMCMRFSLEEAEIRFPYLFHLTNSLLYRKF